MNKKETPLEALKSMADTWQLEMLNRVEAGEYDLIPLFGNYCPGCSVYSDKVLDEIFLYLPETEEAYNAVIDTWANSKGGFPIWVFEELSAWVLPSWLKELPPPYFKRDYVTVYRGGVEADEEHLIYTPSWTIDKSVALWFCARLQRIFDAKQSNEKAHLYKAKISPYDIIAYTEQRNEQEIVQCGGVYDIEDVSFSVLDLEKAIEAHTIKKVYTYKEAQQMITNENIERRIRYRLKKHGLKMHKVNNYGNVWYQVLEIDDDPKEHADDEHGWFTLDKLLEYAEELAEKEHED